MGEVNQDIGIVPTIPLHSQPSMSVSAAGTVLFAVYLVVMVVVGIVSARYQRSSADFWVANRSIGLPVLVMANMAAIMHGGSVLSGVGIMGQVGAVAGLPYLAFVGGVAVVFFVLAKKLRNSEGFTLPDYMGDRFDSNFLRGFSAVIVAFSSVIYLIAQIRVMGFILERLIGVPFFWGMLIGTVVFVFYVAIGGLLAVVWTNIAQFVFMWLGLLLMGPLRLRAGGRVVRRHRKGRGRGAGLDQPRRHGLDDELPRLLVRHLVRRLCDASRARHEDVRGQGRPRGAPLAPVDDRARDALSPLRQLLHRRRRTGARLGLHRRARPGVSRSGHARPSPRARRLRAHRHRERGHVDDGLPPADVRRRRLPRPPAKVRPRAQRRRARRDLLSPGVAVDDPRRRRARLPRRDPPTSTWS